MRQRAKERDEAGAAEHAVATHEAAAAQGRRVKDKKNATARKNAGAENLRGLFARFAGKGRGLPKDLARNHDHYLHGAPKK